MSATSTEEVAIVVYVTVTGAGDRGDAVNCAETAVRHLVAEAVREPLRVPHPAEHAVTAQVDDVDPVNRALGPHGRLQVDFRPPRRR